MEEALDLLTAWGHPELGPLFLKNEINVQALAALTDDDIKEIILQLGPRALFVRCWKAWVAELSGSGTRNQHSRNPSLDLSSICQNLPVLIEQYLPTPTSIIRVEATQQTSLTTSTQIDMEDNDLFKLLQNNFEALGLLRYQGKSLENENARNPLAFTICKETLKKNKNSPISSNTYNKWTKNIKVLFPEERLTTYYIPPRVTAQGITHQARGKLVSQLMNTRRKYQKLGVLDSKERKLHIQSLSSQLVSPRPLPLSATTTVTTNNTEDDLIWLNSSSELWELDQSKWKDTLSERSRDLIKSEYSIEQYFDEYPALHKPQDYKLLVDDFNNSYPDHVNNHVSN